MDKIPKELLERVRADQMALYLTRGMVPAPGALFTTKKLSLSFDLKNNRIGAQVVYVLTHR